MNNSVDPTGLRPRDLADKDLACQAVAPTNGPGAGVSFEITYRDPSTSDRLQVVVADVISAGREPSDDGLTLSSGVRDQTISADAVLISEKDGQVVVLNTSSYAPIEVQRSTGSMQLEPGEELKLVGDATVIISGRIFRHEIFVNPPRTSPRNDGASGTQTFLPSDYELPIERKEVLAHLCAPIFYPNRFSGKQTASEISRRIERRGNSVSPKEVNNKIQRTKDSVEENCLTELSDRDELAAFLVTHKLITRQDVDYFVIGE
jgi:hypothetical protein